MAKIVYNTCYGGFGLSDAALERYRTETQKPDILDSDIPRDDKILVKIVEEMGNKASSAYADLRIEEVPAGSLWRIDEYDGSETVMTQYDYTWNVAKD